MLCSAIGAADPLIKAVMPLFRAGLGLSREHRAVSGPFKAQMAAIRRVRSARQPPAAQVRAAGN